MMISRFTLPGGVGSLERSVWAPLTRATRLCSGRSNANDGVRVDGEPQRTAYPPK
jgi:hypothetical protein